MNWIVLALLSVALAWGGGDEERFQTPTGPLPFIEGKSEPGCGHAIAELREIVLERLKMEEWVAAGKRFDVHVLNRYVHLSRLSGESTRELWDSIEHRDDTVEHLQSQEIVHAVAYREEFVPLLVALSRSHLPLEVERALVPRICRFYEQRFVVWSVAGVNRPPDQSAEHQEQTRAWHDFLRAQLDAYPALAEAYRWAGGRAP